MKKKGDIRRMKIARQAEKEKQSAMENTTIAASFSSMSGGGDMPENEELEKLESITLGPGSPSKFD